MERRPLNAGRQLCKLMQINPVFGSLQVLKSKAVGRLNIWSISQIILHKVRAPVTCWEAVVHHSRAVNGVMDGIRLETLSGT